MDVNKLETKDIKVLLFDLNEEIRYKQNQHQELYKVLVERAKQEQEAQNNPEEDGPVEAVEVQEIKE